MKKMVKVILAAAAVVALAVPAMAADKLIVKHAVNATDALKVTDGGFTGFNAATPIYAADVVSPGSVNTSQLHFSLTGADDGGYITSVAENNFFISSGAVFKEGVWTQRAVDGKSVFFGSGAAGFTAYLNQGATVGGPVTASAKFRVTYDGKMGVGTLVPKSALHVVGLPVYADNAAALAGTLTAGAFYRTSTGVLMVVY